MASESLVSLVWTQTWQVAAVAMFVAIAHRLLARQRPHLAQTLWLLVLVKCLAPPIWSSPSGVFCWVRAEWPTSETVIAAPANSSPVVADWPLADRTAAELYRESGGVTPGSLPPKVLRAAPYSSWWSEAWEGIIAFVAAARGGSRWMAACWGLGILATAAVLLARWRLFARRLRQRVDHSSSNLPDAAREQLALESQVRQLADQLQIERRVRVRVVEAAIGPAVVGLFRPTILLPGVLVRELPPEALEPILAHELVHIRRRDLWLCLVQSVANSLWWFHPLVWWANRRLGEEIERCCDEEVVASLGYEPARYAHSLLEVLERKRALRAAPAIPGVRPLQVTANRLERIMRLGQGSRRRTPWWCWISLALTAAFLVPGGAFVAEGREKKRPRRASVPTVPAAPAATVEAPSDVNAAAASDEWKALPMSRAEQVVETPKTLRVYDIKSAISGVAKLHNLSPGDARVVVHRHLQGAIPLNSAQLNDVQLVFQGTEEEHRRLREELPRVAKHGLSQVRIHTRIMTIPNGFPLPVVAQDPERSSSPVNPAGVANNAINVHPLEKKAAEALIAALQANPRANILQSPQVLTYSGRLATISDQVQRPFVVGFQPAEGGDTGIDKVDGGTVKTAWRPQIQVVEEGLMLEFRPQVFDANRVQLAIQLRLQQVQRVETSTVTPALGETPRTIQVPVLDTKAINAVVELSSGKPILIAGLTSGASRGETQHLAVLIDCEVSAPDLSVAQKSGITKVYQVADLVVPIPHSTQLAIGNSHATLHHSRPADNPLAVSPLRATTSPAPQFAQLLALIKATIQPDSWMGPTATSRIEPHASTLSVVVSANEEVHREIGELFNQLRRLQGIQITLEMQAFRTKDNLFVRDIAKRTEISGYAVDPQCLRTYAVDSRQRTSLLAGRELQQLPKVTQFNGRSLATSLPFDESSPLGADPRPWLTLVPVATADHRAVRLRLATGLDDPAELLATATLRTIPQGDSVLVDVTEKVRLARASRADSATDSPPLFRAVVPGVSELVTQQLARQGDEHYWLLITPRVVIVPSEEEAN